MSEVRFGLVGYGLWGQHHARAIADTEGAVLTAIAAATSDSCQRAAQAHAAATVLDDYRQLVTRSDVDLVDIVVPNFLHYEVARAALEAGKHVLLEKPMTLAAAQCRRLVELADKNQRLLALNHELRLSTLWGRLRHLIDAGTIGTPRHVLIELSRFPYRTGSDGWRYDPARVGDWILEEPIHFFDLARWYLADSGEPRSVFARANCSRSTQSALQDNFSAIVEFAGGAYAVVSQSLAAFGHHVSAKVVGTQGALWAWWSGADARSERPTFGLQYGAADNVTEVPFENIPGELAELRQQIADMVQCVSAARSPAASGRDGYWSVAMCQAALRSVQSGNMESIEVL